MPDESLSQATPPTPAQIEAAFQAEWSGDFLPQIQSHIPGGIVGRIVSQHYADMQAAADQVWHKAVAWALSQPNKIHPS